MAFKSYVKVKDKTYMELFGLPWEDFQVGQVFVHRPGLTISQQDNKDEALKSINNAQLHYDANYASQTEWKKCLVDSTLTVQKFIGMTSRTFFRKYQLLKFDKIAMTAPVYGGDTLYSESKILDKLPYDDDHQVGQLRVETTGLNQEQKVVAKLVYHITVFKKGYHPLEKSLRGEYTEVTDPKFNGYVREGDNKLKEEIGIFFEDFEIGETYLHQPGKTVTTEESILQSLQSLEWNPVYVDNNIASGHLNEGRLLMNPSFLIGASTACSTHTCGKVVANLAWENIEYHREVLSGDTLYAETTIVDKKESHSRPDQGIIKVETRSRNQFGELVLSYERTFLIYKKGQGPYGQGIY